MRVWPFRRRAAVPGVVLSSADLLAIEASLRVAAANVLAIRDRQVRGGVIVFRGALAMAPARATDILVARFRPWGYTPFLRAEGGEAVLQAWPLADTEAPPRVGLATALFLATCVSTLVAGWLFFSGSPTFDALRAAPFPLSVASGVPFAFTILAILGCHEFGHYFTARFYHASVSLPYFIPAPPPFLVGTLGAVIRMRSPVRDRNTLFDIAVAGPLAGLAVALPAFVLGLDWSRLIPSAEDTLGGFGHSLLTRVLATLHFGDVPRGMAVSTHPMVDAAWVGFLVTALNLLPIGQLDGGRIAYALFGRNHRRVGLIAFVMLLALGIATGASNWLVWAALVFFLVGFEHSPPLDDITPLSTGRRLVGVVCLILLVLLIPPVPM